VLSYETPQADQVATAWSTDVICALAACSCTPPAIVERFVGIVDEGTVRPLSRCIPFSAASARFSQLCLRKLYVLCSRGTEASAPQGCLLQVRLSLAY
jgi:hypothetical protein